MNSDSSKCPEDSNSTDCLLRTLIRLVGDKQRADDAKIDWDPVTLGFTAMIGIIAIIFALIPVIQAFLAAGRANRRTSDRAIGKWSAKRKRRWNKSEWTFGFVIQVPVFRVDTLLLNIEVEKNNRIEANKPELANNTLTRSNSQKQQTAATWPAFFSRVGLDEVGMTDQSYMVRTVDVGFLPDDLVAAPAYAEVGVIVSAAATAPDAHTLFLEDKTGYPVIIGHGFQFEFRQHPLLGLVGAFLPYDIKDYPVPRLAELKEALAHARGIIEIHTNGMVPILESAINNGEPVDQRRKQVSPKSIMADLFEDGPSNFMDSVDYAFQEAHPQPRFFLPEDWMVKKYHVALASLFWFRASQHAPAIFPSLALGINFSLIPLALNGKYWAEVDLDTIGKLDHTEYALDVENLLTPNWRRFRWCHIYDISRKRPRTHTNHFNKQSSRSQPPATNEGHIEGCKTVLNICLNLLRYPGETEIWFSKASVKSARIRQLALEQLKEVDRWLATTRDGRKDHEHKIINARASRICATTMLLLEAREATRNGILTATLRSGDEDRRSSIGLVNHSSHIAHGDTSGRYAPDFYGNTLRATRQLVNDFNLRDCTLRYAFDQSLEAAKNDSEGGHESRLRLYKEHADPSDRLFEKCSQDELAKEASRFDKNLDRFDTQLQALLGTGYGMQTRYFNIHRALDRLAEIVVYHSEEDRKWPLWRRHAKYKEDGIGRELDDVIIYRCLIVALLFRTALDSSEMVKSGLWKQVVPII